ncbi:MAG: PKD domain-containing protein [Candidatus Bipolaricaulia bacterium]
MAQAQPAPAIQVQQGEFQKTIHPVTTAESAVAYYNYSALDFNARTREELPRHTLLFVHRNAETNALSLVIIHNAPDAGSAGQAGFKIDGLPSSASLVLRDDPSDTFDLANGQFQWRWASGHTDGLVIEGLKSPTTLEISPRLDRGIVGWKLLTQKTANGPAKRVPMPSQSEPVTVAIGEGLPAAPRDGDEAAEDEEPAEPGPELKAEFRTSPEPGFVGVPVALDASPSTGEIEQYEWDVDGDGTFDISTSKPTTEHVYDQAGSYDVTLRLTGADGNTATFTDTIEIREAETRATRTISTPEAQPGTMFRVTIDLTVGVASNGFGIEETLPANWVVEPVKNDGGVFKFTGNTAQWVFPNELSRNETRQIIYDVRVPRADVIAQPLPTAFAISGTVQSVSPSFTAPIMGESDVRVVSCLTPAVAYAHLNLGQDRVDLRTSEAISAEQRRRAVSDWQSDAPALGTCDSTLSADQLISVVRHHRLSTPVDEALPSIPADKTQVEITRTIQSSLTGDRLYLPKTAGRQFRVTLTVRANRDVAGLVVSESLPDSWEVTPRGATGVFKPSTRAWALPVHMSAGSTKTLVYDVVVPENTATGVVEISGEGDLGDAPFVIDVGGESAVEVLSCLPIPLAAAHLDVDTGELDINLDNTISRAQVDAAFALWLEDGSLPGTCGQDLSLAILQKLIDLMLAGEPVGELGKTD